jgi:hypothetical protein
MSAAPTPIDPKTIAFFQFCTIHLRLDRGKPRSSLEQFRGSAVVSDSPSDRDLGCGFQVSLSPGTLSRIRRVAGISSRNSVKIGSTIDATAYLLGFLMNWNRLLANALPNLWRYVHHAAKTGKFPRKRVNWIPEKRRRRKRYWVWDRCFVRRIYHITSKKQIPRRARDDKSRQGLVMTNPTELTQDGIAKPAETSEAA